MHMYIYMYMCIRYMYRSDARYCITETCVPLVCTQTHLRLHYTYLASEQYCIYKMYMYTSIYYIHCAFTCSC